MTYAVKITPTAEEDLTKFDFGLQRRFFKRIEKLKDYPDMRGKPLRGPLAGKWEIRFERRWRIIYVINEEMKQVEVIAILHKDEFR